MVLDAAAGGVLIAGAATCAAIALREGGARAARLLFAAALTAAAVAELGDGAWPDDVAAGACMLAAGGIALLVRARVGPISRLSWLDAAMGASAAAALAALAGGDAPQCIAVAGIAGGLGLSRWRPGRDVVIAFAGLAALGADPAVAPLAAVAFTAAVWRAPERIPEGPEFSPLVLGALLGFAATALTLLGVGQFIDIGIAAPTLAIVTVLTGMARAGITVVERLRESEHRSITDDLTGLGNRRHLLDRLRAAIEEGGDLALLLVDLDGFKELNDTLGHHAGDEVLRQIGPRLSELLRDDDTLARLGGDEFAVVLAPGDEAAASTAGLRLRGALERSFQVGGIRVHIDASVGIALFPEHSRDALGLLQRADVAMYEAKRMRTGHEVYLPRRDRHSRERLALVGELHGALRAGQLIVHYQPKADLRTAAVRGVEALVRWEHPERGLLGPGHFLPLVEQSGLTRALTTFVLDRALEDIGERRRAGFDLSVAVNLGPADLLDLGLPSEVERLLGDHDFPAEALQLEVSEDVVMADIERTMEVIVGLRRAGVHTALDDFGAGHSALSHLKQLQVDVLKIDRGFVMRIDDEHDAAIAHSVVDLARRLGLHVVAEGVETLEAWDLLAEWGCDEAQGHLIGRAMPADELAAWLTRPGPRAPSRPGPAR